MNDANTRFNVVSPTHLPQDATNILIGWEARAHYDSQTRVRVGEEITKLDDEIKAFKTEAKHLVKKEEGVQIQIQFRQGGKYCNFIRSICVHPREVGDILPRSTW